MSAWAGTNTRIPCRSELDLNFDDAEKLKLGEKVGTVSEDAKAPILQQVTEIIACSEKPPRRRFTFSGERSG